MLRGLAWLVLVLEVPLLAVFVVGLAVLAGLDTEVLRRDPTASLRSPRELGFWSDFAAAGAVASALVLPIVAALVVVARDFLSPRPLRARLAWWRVAALLCVVLAHGLVAIALLAFGPMVDLGAGGRVVAALAAAACAVVFVAGVRALGEWYDLRTASRRAD